MVGSPLMKFVQAERRATIDDYLKTIADTGEAQGMLHLAHTDGEVRVIAYRNKLIATPGRTPYVLGFGVDITEQVRAEGRLRTLTRQSDSILESVGDGIFCIDLEGQVTVVNAAAAQMLGYKQDEMLGRVMHNLIHHTKPDGASYPSEESPIRKSLSNFGTARVIDEVFWRKDGTSFPVEYVARPLIDTYSGEGGEARAVGVVVAFTDTTERRALDRMKDEFISTVSHELRTPLTSLRGALGPVGWRCAGIAPGEVEPDARDRHQQHRSPGTAGERHPRSRTHLKRQKRAALDDDQRGRAAAKGRQRTAGSHSKAERTNLLRGQWRNRLG